MKLVPSKDLGNIVHPHIYSLKSLFMTTHSLEVSTLFTFTYSFINHFTYTLEYTVNFLKYMVIEHVFMKLESLSKNVVLTNYESCQNNARFMN